MIYSSERITYTLIFFLNFLIGVEYGVVIPTALQYLRKYGGNQVDLGLCISAYSFASLFSSPLMGKLSDKLTRNVKAIIVVCNLFQIVGSFIYFIGVSKEVIIGGRLISGIGIGCLGCVFSDIVKTTEVNERTTRLSRVMIGRQIGLIIGPSFNLIALHFNYQIGPFLLDNLSAPGFLMAVSWFVLQILVILFYTNLHKFKEEAEPLPAPLPDDVQENSPLLNSSGSNSYQSPIRIVDNSETGHVLLRLYNDYIRDEVITVFFTAFTVIFMQTSLETLLTPLTKDYFDWTDAQNSILYAVCGVEIMLVFILLSIISKKVSERILMVIGLIGNLSTLIILIIWLPVAIPGSKTLQDYLLFGIPVFFNVFSLPLIVLPTISLLSKVTDIKSQGLTQGLRSVFVGLAQILGPNWAGAFYKNWYICLGVLIVLISLSLSMSLISYRKLKGERHNFVAENENHVEQTING